MHVYAGFRDATRDRRSVRLQNVDYRRPGAYVVTICTHERAPLFGSVVNNRMRLSPAGEIVRQCWLTIPKHFPNVVLDEFVVMPDHMHGIIVIKPDASSRHRYSGNVLPRRFGRALKGSLATIVGVFKSYVTKRIMTTVGIRHVWQRNYYESVIRNREHLDAVRKYIVLNPKRWGDHRPRNM